MITVPASPTRSRTGCSGASAGEQTKAKGSGLGLYLVKTLVEHYGGDIRVEDRVPGDYSKGAKFIITIPSSE